MNSNLGNTREVLAVGHVAHDVDVLVVTSCHVLVDNDAASAVGLGAGLLGNHLAQRGSGHAGGPNLAERRDELLGSILHVLVGDALFIDVSHHRAQLDDDAHLLQGLLSLATQTLAKRR